MHRSSRAPVLSATFRRLSCWITDRRLPCGSCRLAAHGGGWQGRRERSWPAATGATEDAARRRRVLPRRCEIRGRWRSLGDLDDLGEPPTLRLRERPRLDNADDVAHVRGVLLVVRVELDATADDLLVARVRLDRVDLDDDRLVHRTGDDDATALLAAATLGLRLRRPRDRLALGRALPHRLRALPTL